jgi:hypothetical protein
MQEKLITVAETPEFIKKAEKLLTTIEREELIYYLSSNPEIGKIIQGSGEIRKVRWAKSGSGKSGGVRVIYFYYDKDIPLILLTLFGKNEKSNLTQSEVNSLAKLTKILKGTYRK